MKVRNLIQSVLFQEVNKLTPQKKEAIRKHFVNKTFRGVYQVDEEGKWIFFYRTVKILMRDGKLLFQTYVSLKKGDTDWTLLYHNQQTDAVQKEHLRQLLEKAVRTIQSTIRSQLNHLAVDPNFLKMEYQYRKEL